MTAVELKLKSGRGTLQLIRKDIIQIFNVGKSAIEKSERDLTNNFLAMFPSSSELKSKYLEKFEYNYNLAVIEQHESFFPTDEDIRLRNEMNTIYYKIIEFHNTITQKLNVCSSPENSSNDSSRATLNQSLTYSRLPKVELPKFSGVLVEWPKFKQLFDSIIHSNKDIPTIEKYHYLSTSIIGEARSTIASLTINDENYPKAWTALCKRYDNKRLLAISYIDKILDFSPPKGSPSLSTLQSFIANVGENIAAFKSIEIENEADFIWLTLALRKLDPETRKQFEVHAVKTDWPTFENLIEFVYGRCRVLQLSECGDSSRSSRTSKPHILTTTNQASSSPSEKFPCTCHPSHPLYQCPIFRSKSPGRRKDFLKGKIICFNCLALGHISRNCTSTGRCKTCQGRHHTLLHSSKNPAPNPSAESCPLLQPSKIKSNPPVCNNPPSTSFIASVTGPTQVILGTAEALILDYKNSLHSVRLLVDCGSQFSLITSECARRLGLTWRPSKHRPLGAGETPLPKVKGKLNCQLQSRIYPDQLFNVEPLVVCTITGALPTSLLTPITSSNLNFNQLADPEFWIPKPIDFLLGGDVFMSIIKGTPRYLGDNYQALPTAFGLVIMGTNDSNLTSPNTLHCHCLVDPPISNEVLLKFWETENVPLQGGIHEFDPCEEHFTKTHYRDKTGRYVVAYPFKSPREDLSESMTSAAQQYQSLERKMNRNPEFKNKYHSFLQEYLDLGHMSPATAPSSYIIPHHGVFKSNDPDSKIRVVFNASAATSKGSLNDKLLIGPKLQQDISLIILNFRRHLIAVVGDLVKMYRQILIRPEDRCFQHILWRQDSSKEVEIFELNTVTYGVASAPFQALRTIKQLVLDEGKPFPLASKALDNDMYVDDIVSGANTLEDAIRLRKELSQLLAKGHFQAHKWASNSTEFMQSLDIVEDCSPLSLCPKDSCITKILGMIWDPAEDTFSYQIHPVSQAVTKRTILSVIARLFDPMGYLAPVIFKAKTILQNLWSSKVDWDDIPEQHIIKEWQEISRELHHLTGLRIPRYILSNHVIYKQILGFCDASQKGFAAALYLRVVSSKGEVKVSLLKAKTKLAPLKTISVPRLELSGAHLLVKLILSVQHFLKLIDPSHIFLFTDSTIVLSWLRLSPHLLQTFVGNRISFIVTHTKVSQWYHIPSEDNPADVASRGLAPSLLRHHSLWWAGPSRLQQPDWNPSSPPHFHGDIPELKSGLTLAINTQQTYFISWMCRHSRFSHMLRVMAYVRRFIFNCRSARKKLSGQLTVDELDSALSMVIRITQSYEFAQEFSWEHNRPLSTRLRILAAYADEKGVIRVGGRLQNADLSEDTKFPIILPGKCHLIRLMISHLHTSNFHLGFQALQALLRRKYWVFRLRQVIKSQLNKCLTCFKFSARSQTPFMGNLPSCRVLPSRPFSECGTDFAGPFSIKLSTRRNASISKAYLCVFICMSTRAVHLELVSSLSTQAFLATLDRFIARRGCPTAIYSDCGTNFVGAERRLRELFNWIRTKDTKDELQHYSSTKRFQWHFNPPSAPNFGGIWEAAVKSAKRHLYKVTQDRVFNYEELTTLFTRIEAALNSRPLCPMQEDTSQGDVLTPGHFLIGAPLLALPEKDHTEIPLSRLSRWQLITNTVQHFWKRWHAEYIQSMQRRPKWYHFTKPLKIGDLVLIPDSRSAPLQWKLARIIEVHPGEDGITRVVTLKDNNGIYKRPVSKLVSLTHLQEPEVAQE